MRIARAKPALSSEGDSVPLPNLPPKIAQAEPALEPARSVVCSLTPV